MSIGPSDIDPADQDAFEESRIDYEEERADQRREADADEYPKPPRDTRNGDPGHFLPGNFRQGTSPRPKKGASESAAKNYAREHGFGHQHPYVCLTCGQWHLASKPKEG